MAKDISMQVQEDEQDKPAVDKQIQSQTITLRQ